MTFQSSEISASLSSYEFSLYRKSNRNWNQMETFPIGFPIETGIMPGHRSRYFTTLKCNNFLANGYFSDWSKNKSPNSDVVYSQELENLARRDARFRFRKAYTRTRLCFAHLLDTNISTTSSVRQPM